MTSIVHNIFEIWGRFVLTTKVKLEETIVMYSEAGGG
jgi:hypothetical protein